MLDDCMEYCFELQLDNIDVDLEVSWWDCLGGDGPHFNTINQEQSWIRRKRAAILFLHTANIFVSPIVLCFRLTPFSPDADLRISFYPAEESVGNKEVQLNVIELVDGDLKQISICRSASVMSRDDWTRVVNH